MKELERANVAGVRRSLAALGAVVAEVDRELRYLWVDNPHPDFDPGTVAGKRDDELLSAEDAADIISLKRETFERETPVSRILRFRRSDGVRYYSLFAYPVRSPGGRVDSILTVGFDVPAPAQETA
ncbi:MAG TPA: PAS domain-containing protein [Burkholderiales bacterium]